jgi:SSS family solute:Na+ symporter
VPASYAGWPAADVGMVLGLVLTVGVSAITSPAAGEDTTVYSEAVRAD